MSTAALVSFSEYLSTNYRPDQELLEGHLTERNLGEFEHSNLQGAILVWMRQRQHERHIRVLPEQRIQVSSARFRVPDICVISRDQPVEPVFTRPPLLCIEVLSKDDTLRSLQDRIDDYRLCGIPHIWVLDPVKRRAYVCQEGDFREPANQVLSIPQTAICISLPGLFAELD